MNSFEDSSSDDLYNSSECIPNAEIESKFLSDTNDAIEKPSLSIDRVKKNPKTEKICKNKKIYCLFCEKLETNLPRQLQRKHATEPDVRKFKLLPKKNKERLKKLNFK